MTGGLTTAYPDPADSPGFALWRATNAWQRRIRAVLAPLELTHVQFVLLAVLAWRRNREPLTQRQLADHAGTDPMMTSQVLRALEQRSLLARSAHPEDRRAILVTITSAGAALADEAVSVVEAADAAYFTALGPGAIRQLTSSLRRLAAE